MHGQLDITFACKYKKSARAKTAKQHTVVTSALKKVA